jgi:hypothetical protein
VFFHITTTPPRVYIRNRAISAGISHGRALCAHISRVESIARIAEMCIIVDYYICI